jgi:D-alanine transaminase
MTHFAFINGSFVPHTEAGLSILDRGFFFADGIYKTRPGVSSLWLMSG